MAGPSGDTGPKWSPEGDEAWRAASEAAAAVSNLFFMHKKQKGPNAVLQGTGKSAIDFALDAYVYAHSRFDISVGDQSLTHGQRFASLVRHKACYLFVDDIRSKRVRNFQPADAPDASGRSLLERLDDGGVLCCNSPIEGSYEADAVLRRAIWNCAGGDADLQALARAWTDYGFGCRADVCDAYGWPIKKYDNLRRRFVRTLVKKGVVTHRSDT